MTNHLSGLSCTWLSSTLLSHVTAKLFPPLKSIYHKDEEKKASLLLSFSAARLMQQAVLFLEEKKKCQKKGRGWKEIETFANLETYNGIGEVDIIGIECIYVVHRRSFFSISVNTISCPSRQVKKNQQLHQKMKFLSPLPSLKHT